MSLKKKTAKKLAECEAVGAYRQLLLYRGSKYRFSVEEAVGHEMSCPAKERSAMLLIQGQPLKTLVDNDQEFKRLPRHEKGVARCVFGLMFSIENIVKAYPGQGDVWTVRSKQNPNTVVRTRKGSAAFYDECIVTGRPSHLVLTIRGDRNAAGAALKKAKWLAAKYSLDLIVQ